MISVTEAQALCLDLAVPMASEVVELEQACGRVLAAPVTANHAQPPFASSAMDGYAVLSADVRPDNTLTVVGESAAGHGWNGTLSAGQAVRIFTGAPVPDGADFVVIQEDVIREDDTITIRDTVDNKHNIRPLGVDFDEQFKIGAGRRLSAIDLALLAAMNAPTVSVTKRPTVGILATGDELVPPGSVPTKDQIISSNVYAIKAMVDQAGGAATILPIAPDTIDGLKTAMTELAKFDIAITIGGASVGEYDLVGQVGQDIGLTRSFYKIAMRPGKPLIAGKLAGVPFLGLPGNPVSSIVCAKLFLVPLVQKMLGLPDVLPTPERKPLAVAIGTNGPRKHYMRATLSHDMVTPAKSQDSSLLSVLAVSNCLIIRPENDQNRAAGDIVEILHL